MHESHILQCLMHESHILQCSRPFSLCQSYCIAHCNTLTAGLACSLTQADALAGAEAQALELSCAQAFIERLKEEGATQSQVRACLAN